MVAYVALMCDYTEKNDRTVETYILRFKRKKSKGVDKCILLTLLLRSDTKQTASSSRKHHGLLRTSASIYEYGTFFEDQIEKICTNWNGSFFSIIYLLFNYSVWYQVIKGYVFDDKIHRRNDEDIENQYFTYARILLFLFYYMQVHYCFHYLKTFNFIRQGRPVTYFNRIISIGIMSTIYPFCFILFCPIMWIFRRIFSKRAWFANMRCSKSFRHWLFPKNNINNDAYAKKLMLIDEEDDEIFYAQSKKSKSSSRWNCCCFCCRPEHEEDDDDVIFDLFSKSKKNRNILPINKLLSTSYLSDEDDDSSSEDEIEEDIKKLHHPSPLTIKKENIDNTM